MDTERTRFALKKALHSLKNFECYMDGNASPFKVVVVSDKFRNTDNTARVARVSKMLKEGAGDVFNAKAFTIECFTYGEWDKAPAAKRAAFTTTSTATTNTNHNNGNVKKAA